MPDRILRASILTSDRVAGLRNWETEVFFRRLFSVADDYGRYDARPAILRAHLYPLQLDKMSEAGIERCLLECERVRLVRLYSVEGYPYLEIAGFGQRVQSKPKWPAPGDFSRDASVVHGGFPGHSESYSDGCNRREGEGCGVAAVLPSPCSEEDFQAFASRVLTLRPAWSKCRMVPKDCEAAARDAAASLELAEDDFSLLAAYYASTMPKDRYGAAFWRPAGLEQFFRAMPDVLSHAYRWRKETGWRVAKSAACPPTVPADGEDAATLESFRQSLAE